MLVIKIQEYVLLVYRSIMVTSADRNVANIVKLTVTRTLASVMLAEAITTGNIAT